MKLETDQDLITMILSGAERPDFDYKDDIDLTGDKKHKAELTKDIIAMANSGGGLIVGGVGETTGGYNWKGMSDHTLKAFDSTALNDFVKNYSAPPINTTTRKIQIEGKVYGVIIVPEFYEQPHIVIRNYDQVLTTGHILVRSASNNSVCAGPDDVRKLIDLAVRRRQGVLKEFLQAALEDTRPQLVGGATSVAEEIEVPFDRAEYSRTYKGFRVMALRPEGEQIRLRPMDLRHAVEEAIIYTPNGYERFPPAVFPGSVEQRLPIGVAFEQTAGPNSVLTFTFLGVDGSVFCVESLWEDGRWPPTEESGVVGIVTTTARILDTLLFGRKYYSALGFQGSVQIQYSLESSVPRQAILDSGDLWFPRVRYDSVFSVPVKIQATTSAKASLEQLETLTQEMIREFFWYFHLDLGEGDVDSYLEQVKAKLVRVPEDLGA